MAQQKSNPRRNPPPPPSNVPPAGKPAPSLHASISWTALEYEPREKRAVWFTLFFLIFGGLIAFGFYTKSYITVVLFVLLAAVSYGFAVKRPRRLGHIIGPTGITVGKTSFPYKEIKKFWIHYDPAVTKTLNFETTAYVNNMVTLQLDKQDPIEVRNYLKKYLAEDLDREETLSDAIARKLKF
ncbi:MAG: hypothetical protein ACM3NH_00065 [Candidatus Saccharibacteria bacterium]